MPEAIAKDLISSSPKTQEEVERLLAEVQPEKEEVKERPHQTTAIENWRKNGHQGIISMATGGGKTLTALFAIQHDDPKNLVLVIVPTNPLQNQWQEEIKRADPKALIIPVGGDTKEDWESPDSRLTHFLDVCRISNGIPHTKDYSRVYVVAIEASATKDEFLKKFERVSQENIQLIIDEVHHAGSDSGQKIFSIPCERRIGLSATHKRFMDDEGTDKIEDFFKGSGNHKDSVVYTLKLDDAINAKSKGTADQDLLCHYQYYPEFTELTDKEFNTWHSLSKEIGQQKAIIDSTLKKDPNADVSYFRKKLKALKQERALNLKKRTLNKKEAFNRIVNKIPKDRQVLVFCEDTEQLDSLVEVLKNNSKSFRIYKSKGLTKEQKKSHLGLFAKGEIDYLISMKALDEGLDVPDCDTCIIVASDTSPRQSVQRRGRILRIGLRDIAKVAHLYDIFCVPPMSSNNLTDKDGDHQPFQDSIESLFQHEINTMNILAEAADNRTAVEADVDNMVQKYNCQMKNFIRI